jgi:hypothetical protein
MLSTAPTVTAAAIGASVRGQGAWRQPQPSRTWTFRLPFWLRKQLAEADSPRAAVRSFARLASFASLLAVLCRAEDLPARLGGDEFSVLLPGVDLDGALRLAERVLAAVRSCADLAKRGVTVSAGTAAWKPDELPNDLLRRADEALYAAKRSGGDSVAARD